MTKIKEIFKIKKNFSWCSALDTLAESFYLLAIFSLPIYLSFFLDTEHPFELNKIFLLKLLLILLFFVTSLREIIFPSQILYQLKKIFLKYWLWPTVFIVFLLVSLFFSADPALSFWGTLDREQGVLSYLLYFSFFILLSFNLIVFSWRKKGSLISEDDKKIFFTVETKRVIWTIIFSTLVVSLYGVLQFLGIDYYQWMEPAFLTGRSFSFLGQPNFFASWLLLVIPLLIWLIFVFRNKWLKLFVSFVSILSIIALITTSSRAAFVALIVTFLIFIFLIVYLSKFRLRYKKAILLVSFLILLAFVLVLKFSMPERIKGLIDFNGGSVSARLDFYGASISAIKERPIFGYGQENLYSVFMSDYQSRWANHSYIGQTPDKVHNLILDILMTTGFLGLIFYFFFYRYYFLLVFRNIKKDKFYSLSLVLGLGGLAYLISLLFGFAVVVTEFYFFTFLALLVLINYQLEDKKDEEKAVTCLNQKKLPLQVVLIVIVVLLSSFFGLRSVHSLLADYYFSEAKTSFNRADFHEAMTLLEYIDELYINPVAKSCYAQASSIWILPLFPFEEEKVLNNFFRDRLLISFSNLMENQPLDLLMKARISASFKDYSQSDYYLNKFDNKYPTWPLGVLAGAKLKFAAGKKDQALEKLDYLLSIIADPNNPVVNDEHRLGINSFKQETLYLIAQIYESSGDYALAEKYYRLVYLQNPLDYSLLKKVADMLYLQKNYSQALIVVEEGMRLSPVDYNWPLLASYLYQELAEFDLSNNFLEKAIELGFKQ